MTQPENGADKMSTQKRVTIKDVAARAGVSISTASRALRSHPDVNEETRERIIQISKDLGYRPSLLARSLLTGVTSTIGLLISDISNPFYPQLASVIETSLHAEGYTVVLCNTSDDPELSRLYMNRLVSQGVDGIIHASIGADEEYLTIALESGVPAVLVNRRPRFTQDVDCVITDNVKGGILAVSHLVDLGHKRIAHLAGPRDIIVSEQREQGYGLALEDANIAHDPSLVIRCDSFSFESGAQATEELMSMAEPPSAIFAVNDVVALGCLSSLLEMGYAVPDDVAVIGFDDIDIASLGFIQLSTVSQDIRTMGKIAVERLLNAIHDPERHRFMTTTLEPALIVRRSTMRHS